MRSPPFPGTWVRQGGRKRSDRVVSRTAAHPPTHLRGGPSGEPHDALSARSRYPAARSRISRACSRPRASDERCIACLVLSRGRARVLVIVVGAYVRLEDAGLGCPDWPGCYGQMLGVPGRSARESRGREQAFPGKTVDAGRARKEMFHRYLAGALGLLILAIAVDGVAPAAADRPFARACPGARRGGGGCRRRSACGRSRCCSSRRSSRCTSWAAWRRWRSLTWLALREIDPPAPPAATARATATLGRRGTGVLVCQIALGGWVSANYAALACPDFPDVPRAVGAGDGFPTRVSRRARARHDRERRAAHAGGAHRDPVEPPRRRAGHGSSSSAASALAALRIPALAAFRRRLLVVLLAVRLRWASRTCCSGCRSCWRPRTTRAPRFCWRCSWC